MDLSPFSQSVPVFVEAAEDGTYRVVETGTRVVLSSEHATAKQACAAALELAQVSSFVKRASLRNAAGELDAEWRWVDAAAEEDAPIGGVRIGELAVWQLAESLNVKGCSAPVNGGPTPAGLAPSECHGDQAHGGDHPANGFAHVGLPVLATDGRTHLFLWCEFIPEVAAELDRGRLAYGSVYFAYTTIDMSDDRAAVGAVLISHGLTNDPANTTLAPGSERQRVAGTTNLLRAARSAWRSSMDLEQIQTLITTARNTALPSAERFDACRQLIGTRGVVTDHYHAVLASLGISPADVASNPWAAEDAIFDFEFGAYAEARLDAMAPPPAAPPPEAAPPPAPDPVAASATAREFEGLEGEAAEAALEALVTWARSVLGKPGASIEDVQAELTAREEEFSALTPGEAETTETEPAAPGAGAAAAAASATQTVARATITTLRAEKAELEERVTRLESRDWLTEELRKRGLSLRTTPDEGKELSEFDELVETCVRHGRDVVLQALRFAQQPPAPRPIDHDPQANPSLAPTSQGDAVKRCLGDLPEALKSQDEHVQRRHATARARTEWPDLFLPIP